MKFKVKFTLYNSHYVWRALNATDAVSADDEVFDLIHNGFWSDTPPNIVDDLITCKSQKTYYRGSAIATATLCVVE